MGIEGFKLFVSTNSETFFETINLCNKSLVIEGDCLIHELYGRCIDKIYVNKYADFEKKVSKFLDDLLDCQITPIIVFKGGKEVQNLTKDSKELEDSILKVELGIEKKRVTRLPILLEEIVKFIAKGKGINFVQSVFKTEYDIVSIAKIFDCPVLSNVNSYYLHTIMFIPFSEEMKKIKIEKNFVFQCKLYKTESILKYFSDPRTMAVAKVLMNNFLRRSKVFINFYSSLPINNEIKSRSVRRVQAVLSWFEAHHTLDEAIDEILKTVDAEHCTDLIKNFENSVYEHTNISPRLLKSLGVPEEVTNEILLESQSLHAQYKYNKPKVFNFFERKLDNVLKFKDKKLKINPIFNQAALSWFIEEFNSGKFPPYFIDIYFRKLYIPTIQMENLSYDSCVNISLRIIGVIFRILVENNHDDNLKYVTRGENRTDVEIFELNVTDMNYDFEIPSLIILRDVPLNKRKEIFVRTLEITNEYLDDCPSDWAVFMAAIVYWFKNADSIFTQKCHLYALLLTMTFSDVEEKIVNRNFSVAQKYLIKITEDDCISAKQSFGSILRTKNYFDINEIHAFSLFENCLSHIVHLNALLDYPYPDVNIIKLFDGKIVDRVYHSSKNKRYPLEDIKTIFMNSPSFVKLFETTLSKFQNMI